MKLTNTFFGSFIRFPGDHVHGYGDFDENGQLDEFTEYNMSAVAGCGDGISTVKDLCSWVEALCSGSILKKTSRNEMMTATEIITLDGTYQGYGLGLLKLGFAKEIIGYPFTIYGHNGSVYGYYTWALYSPELDLSVVINTNVDEELEDMRTYAVFFQVVTSILEQTSKVKDWDGLK